MKNETPIQGHYDTSSVFVAVIGRPNVGKSSLTNLLVGEKVAIVTSKPQTTRTRITGVITRGPLQYVLLDTPGVHKPHNKLGKRMDKTASDSIADVDVSMMLFEPYGAEKGRPGHRGHQQDRPRQRPGGPRGPQGGAESAGRL